MVEGKKYCWNVFILKRVKFVQVCGYVTNFLDECFSSLGLFGAVMSQTSHKYDLVFMPHWGFSISKSHLLKTHTHSSSLCFYSKFEMGFWIFGMRVCAGH